MVQEYRYMERAWHVVHKPNTMYFYVGRCCHPRCSKQSLLLCPHTKRDCEIHVRLLLPKSCGRTYVGVVCRFMLSYSGYWILLCRFLYAFFTLPLWKELRHSIHRREGGESCLGPRIFWIFGPEINLLNSTLQGFDKVVWLTHTIDLFWTLYIV